MPDWGGGSGQRRQVRHGRWILPVLKREADRYTSGLVFL
jgi:hypothetical protein